MKLITTLVIEVLNPLLLISLALFVSLCFILSLLIPVSIAELQSLFWLSVIVPLFGLIIRARTKWREVTHKPQPFSWKAMLPLLPLLILVPAVWAEFAHPTMQITHHGDIHIAFIHQLLFDATPAENVFAAGLPSNYHWLYHAYLTPFAQFSSFSPASVASIANVVAVYSGCLWIGQTLRLLKLGRPNSLRFGFLILLVFFSVNITSSLRVLTHFVNGTYEPYAFDIMLLPGANFRLHSTLGKVFNFQSMTLGIAIFAAALFAFVKLVKDNAEPNTLVLISACGIATLAVREIAALYIVLVLLGGFAVMTGLEWLREGDIRTQVRKFWQRQTGMVSPLILLIWFCVSLVLSVPLVKYNLDIASGFNLGRPFGLSIPNVKMIIAALLLFLPLFAMQTIWALKKGKRAQRFIQISCVLGLALSTVLTLPDTNQGKTIFLSSMLVAISALSALKNLRQLGGYRSRVAGMLEILFIVLVVSQIAYVSSNFLNKVRAYGDTGHRFIGRHIEFADDVDGRLPAYRWIRDHTAYNSVVLLPLIPTKYSNLFHERMLYVRILQLHFGASNFGYAERVAELDAFYDGTTRGEDYQRLLDKMQSRVPGRPIYAVVKDGEVSAQVMDKRSARLVFEPATNVAKVYWLNPDSAP